MSMQQPTLVQWPVSRPITITPIKHRSTLNHLSAEGYRLVRPLLLDVEHGQGSRVTVWEEHSTAYGVGYSEAEATRDLESMLLEMYQHLSETEATLSSALRERLTYLRSVLVPSQMQSCP